ncbi:MAG: hypothetical protein HN353_07825 [Bdellovibrionales bacterium]|jgi:ribonuclease III|nr:hypothetical protein [Bdellovibrionales bacterium]MBT3525827.1 hypothetical protein [Bdellovibrionales bacterium]MBT7668310.1 hypothetical protein [Bdellovibrionales bacterium]MBT7767925.1 hypothetical protein [Bdellovibrionales bacterium]
MRNNDSYLSNNESNPLFALSRKVHTLAQANNLKSNLDLANYVIKSPAYQETSLRLHLAPNQIDRTLLVQALVHTSFHHEFNSKIEPLEHNEQLEFLGDSVISLMITTLIYQQFPTMSEGDLSKLRSSLVNKDVLGELGEYLQLDRLILVGRGEIKRWGHNLEAIPRSLLTSAFEALIGVLYLQLGFKQTLAVMKNIIDQYSEVSGVPFINQERLDDFDPKSRLQEITMALYKQLPVYHDQVAGSKFTVSLTIGERLIGEVSSNSKREAKQQLSLMALKQLKGEGALSC